MAKINRAKPVTDQLDLGLLGGVDHLDLEELQVQIDKGLADQKARKEALEGGYEDNPLIYTQQSELEYPEDDISEDIYEGTDQDNMPTEEREAQRVLTFQEQHGMPRNIMPNVGPPAPEEFGLQTLKQVLGESFERLETTANKLSNNFNPILFPRKHNVLLGDRDITPELLARYNPMVEGKPIVSRIGPMTNLTTSTLMLSDYGLQAGIKTKSVDGVPDIRGYKIYPQFGVLMAATLEKILVKDLDAAHVGNLNAEEKDGLIVKDQQDTATRSSVIGRAVFANWRRAKAYMEGEPSDSYLEHYSNLSEEAFTMIGDMAKEMYHKVNPKTLARIRGEYDFVNQKGIRAYEYELTEHGRKALADGFLYEPINLTPPALRQVSDKYRLVGEVGVLSVRDESGLGRPAKGREPIMEEILYNAHNMRSFVDPTRAKIYYLLAIPGIKGNFLQTNKDHTPAAFMGLGKDRWEKIQSAVTKEEIKKTVAEGELAKAEWAAQRYGNTENRDRLKTKLRDINTNIKLFKTKDWQERTFYQHANKQVEGLVHIAHYDDGKPVYFTYSQHKTSLRITIQQSGFSHQGSKQVRALLGSGHVYQIAPGSGSKHERAFVETIGTLLFRQGVSLPDAVVRNTREIFRAKGEDYTEFVRVGGILKEVLENFDPKSSIAAAKAIKVIPNKGIIGIEKMPVNYPPVLYQDAGVKTFLDRVRGEKDYYIQLIEAAVELYKYDKASQTEGGSFSTTMNAIEVDGISNGLAIMFAIMGLRSQLHRAGVLRAEGEELILGNYAEKEGQEPYSGDIRDVLREAMRDYSGLIMDDSEFKKTHDLSDDEIPDLVKALDLALGDRENFLKGPMLRFPYGQESKNLINGVYDTILGNKDLEKIGDGMEGGVARLAKLLHGILEQNLSVALGPIVELSKQLKGMAELITSVGETISFTNVLGDTSILGGKSEIATEETSSYRMRNVSSEAFIGDPDKDTVLATGRYFSEKGVTTEGDDSSLELTVSPYKREIDVFKASYIGGPIGGKAMGQMLPVFAQSVDGSIIGHILSGSRFDKLNSNPKKPVWYLPIFDAVQTDLDSFEDVRNQLNSSFKELTMNTDMLTELSHKFGHTIDKGTKQLRKNAIDSIENKTTEFTPKEKVHAEYLVSKLKPFFYKEPNHPMLDDLVLVLAGGIKKSEASTPQVALAAASELYMRLVGIKKKITDFRILAVQARKRRAEVVKDMLEVFEYSADNVKMGEKPSAPSH